jgi:hypothetical protein
MKNGKINHALHPAQAELAADLGSIAANIKAVTQHLGRVEAAMRRLEAAGKYPAIPSEQWKDGRYLYMRFDQNEYHDFTLDYKNRLYIGASPARILQARRLAENARRWAALEVWRKNLSGWLRRVRNGVADLARQAASTPNLDPATLELYGPLPLGQDLGAAAAPERPKEQLCIT